MLLCSRLALYPRDTLSMSKRPLSRLVLGSMSVQACTFDGTHASVVSSEFDRVKSEMAVLAPMKGQTF